MGCRVDEKTWFGVNEPLTPSNFVPNEGYKVSVIVSKTGKKYISEILGTEVAQEAPKSHCPSTCALKLHQLRKRKLPRLWLQASNPTRAKIRSAID